MQFTHGMRLRSSRGVTASRCLFLWLSALSALGCNTLDAPPDESAAFTGHLVVPVDERPAIRSQAPALAVTGGTLTVTMDGRFAVAADPERDTISVVSLSSGSLEHSIALDAGSEPGRVIEGPPGRIQVALRRAGAVVSIDPALGSIVMRRNVCRAPRGLAYDSEDGRLHIACAEGKLISLDPASGDVLRTIDTDPDLRDVMVRGHELWVTRFKSAQLLRFDRDGLPRARFTPSEGRGQLTVQSSNSIHLVDTTMQPEVAWKAVPTADGGAMIVHQEAAKDPIQLTKPSAQGSAYGGGQFGTCDGIVRTRLTKVGADGQASTTHVVFGAPLPVDVAVGPNGMVAIAHSGLGEDGLPRPTTVFHSDGSEVFNVAAPSVAVGSRPGGVSLLAQSDGMSTEGSDPAPGGCEAPFQQFVSVPVTAVAFAPNGLLVAQTREPAELRILSMTGSEEGLHIALSSESRLDTGHELFHRDSGGGIACASCHPEGGEDGHVWHFSDTGLRRTQALHVGLRDTAPFHWDGKLPDVGTLMTEVFVGRMGGIRQTSERIGALSDWLFALHAPPPIRDSVDPAAQRGRALFESAETGCTSCHSGAHFTNNRSVSVGTLASGEGLQVPSLVAVGWRAPFMHNGCAPTLAARFDPTCGGAQHGNTSQLAAAQVADLVAYLETL